MSAATLAALAVVLIVQIAGIVLWLGCVATVAWFGGLRPVPGPIASAGRASVMLLQPRGATERFDDVSWCLAPALYAGLALAGLSLIPLSDSFVALDSSVGIVLWGAVEGMAIVAVFLHGWAPNSMLSLIGAYRFVSLGLPILLISMFVVIAATLPAESMRMTDVVASQAAGWNVVRQPLGFPLFVIVALAITFRRPFDFADSADLATGTSVESSGRERLAWSAARAAMSVTFAFCAATLFFGGWRGPWLPGPLWLGGKAGAILLLLAATEAYFGRVPTERAAALVWGILLPLSFVHLLQAGLEAMR